MLLLSRVGGGIHIAQAVQREGERAGGEKGNKRRREGREGWLAGCGVHNRGRWMDGERGILGKDDGREEDGRWGFFMCGRPERGREGSGAMHECNAAEGLRI